MKEGDLFLQRIEGMAQRMRVAKVLWLALAGWEYDPGWVYWLEFGKAVRN